MNVSMLETGRSGVIARIHGGRGLRDHLLRLGIIPGVSVRKIRGGGQGPQVLEVLGANVVIGLGMAKAIEIR